MTDLYKMQTLIKKTNAEIQSIFNFHVLYLIYVSQCGQAEEEELQIPPKESFGK